MPSPSEDQHGLFSWDVLRSRAVKQRCPPHAKWLSQPFLTGPPRREQGALVCLPGQSGLAVLDVVWEVLPSPGLTQPAGSQPCSPSEQPCCCLYDFLTGREQHLECKLFICGIFIHPRN